MNNKSHDKYNDICGDYMRLFMYRLPRKETILEDCNYYNIKTYKLGETEDFFLNINVDIFNVCVDNHAFSNMLNNYYGNPFQRKIRLNMFCTGDEFVLSAEKQ